MRFDRRAVTDPGASALLRHYFTSRELGFTGDAGYRIVPPDPARFTPPAGAFLVAVDETTGAEVGCGGVRRIDPEPDGAVRFEVKHLWVEESARGGGTGRALLTALEAEAASLGAAVVVLDTNASLEAAGRLYRSNGYVGVAPFNDNPNATDWFRKDLRHRMTHARPDARDDGLLVTGSDRGNERKRDSFWHRRRPGIRYLYSVAAILGGSLIALRSAGDPSGSDAVLLGALAVVGLGAVSIPVYRWMGKRNL